MARPLWNRKYNPKLDLLYCVRLFNSVSKIIFYMQFETYSIMEGGRVCCGYTCAPECLSWFRLMYFLRFGGGEGLEGELD